MPSLTSPISADNIRQRYDSFVKEAILNTTIISEYDVTSNPIPGAPGPDPAYYAIANHPGGYVKNLVRWNQSGSYPRMPLWSPSTESQIDVGPLTAQSANLQNQVLVQHAIQFKGSPRPSGSDYDWFYESPDSGAATEHTRRAEDNFPLFANTNNTVTVDADDLVRFIYRETAAWIFIRTWKFVSGVYGVGGNTGTKLRNSPYRYPSRIPLGYTNQGGPAIVHNGKQLYRPGDTTDPGNFGTYDPTSPTNPDYVKYAMDNTEHWSHIMMTPVPNPGYPFPSPSPRTWHQFRLKGPNHTPYAPGTSNTDPAPVQTTNPLYTPIYPRSGALFGPQEIYMTLSHPANTASYHENLLDIGPVPVRMPSSAHFSESALQSAATTAGLVSGNTITTTNLDAYLTAVRDRYYKYANTEVGSMDGDKIKPVDHKPESEGEALGLNNYAYTVSPLSTVGPYPAQPGTDQLVFSSGFGYILSGVKDSTAPTITIPNTFDVSAGKAYKFTSSNTTHATVTAITNQFSTYNHTQNANTTVSFGSNDDGYWTVNLFPLLDSSILQNFLGGTQYIYINTNGSLTFPQGYTNWGSFTESSPALNKILVAARDNSMQRIYTAGFGSGTSAYGVIVIEGTNSTSGTLGSPNINYLWKFNRSDMSVELHINTNAAAAETNQVTLIANSTASVIGSTTAAVSNTNTVTTNIVCHASCHSSCHSSRGRR